MKIDIYGYAKRLKCAEELLQKSKISEKNKKLILDFKRQLSAEGLSVARIIKYVSEIRRIALFFRKDLELVSKADVIDYMNEIDQRDYSEWTKQWHKVCLRRFFQWLRKLDKNKYPEEVEWLNLNIRKDKQKLPGNGELFTEEDIEKLMGCCSNSRDRALVSTLWESGCRIGEVANLRIGDVTFDKYGVVMIVDGKTGSRKIRIVNSTPYLTTWFNDHPHGKDKKSPLWVTLGNKKGLEPLYYGTIRKILQVLMAKSGINKRSNLHLFRHSRATFLANHLTEFQMNQYFGWIQGSDMPSTYVHLSGKEIDNAILELNGVKSKENDNKDSVLKPKICSKCDTINSHNSRFCNKCAGILDTKTAMEFEEKSKKERETRVDSDSIMNLLIKNEEVREFLLTKIAEMGLKANGFSNIGH